MLDLELASTAELIDELTRRKTFLGVIIHAKEQKGEWRGLKMFKVSYNDNLNGDEVQKLLKHVSNRM